MGLDLRKMLAELKGVMKINDDDIRQELEELKIDNKLDELAREGHIATNPEALMLARNAITGKATPEEIEKLLRTPKPVPAKTTTLQPPPGPVEGDPTETAIQAEMAKSGTPYHVAAAAVSAGGSIAPGGTD